MDSRQQAREDRAKYAQRAKEQQAKLAVAVEKLAHLIENNKKQTMPIDSSTQTIGGAAGSDDRANKTATGTSKPTTAEDLERRKKESYEAYMRTVPRGGVAPTTIAPNTSGIISPNPSVAPLASTPEPTYSYRGMNLVFDSPVADNDTSSVIPLTASSDDGQAMCAPIQLTFGRLSATLTNSQGGVSSAAAWRMVLNVDTTGVSPGVYSVYFWASGCGDTNTLTQYSAEAELTIVE